MKNNTALSPTFTEEKESIKAVGVFSRLTEINRSWKFLFHPFFVLLERTGEREEKDVQKISQWKIK